ncbi:MAG: hypothetical protein FWE31_04820, partial [Firmicutes bacterium]|nr:hypothetical protein [Bacillota bacterium]
MSFKKFMVANRTILAISLAGVLVVTGVVLAIVLTRVPRSSILRIANWDYFMDRELVAEFQESWREITGDRRFRVRYTLFDSNEELYRMMDRNRADFDLVVPSEYMVEKMIGENLLKPLDMARLPELTQVIPTAVGPTRVFDETIIDPYITNAILNVTGGVNYAIPYAYGTLGIVYDTSVAGLGDFIRANGWRSLFVQNEDWFASPTT